MCYSLWYNAPTMLPAGGRQHRRCIIPQTVTYSLVLLKMGNMGNMGFPVRNVYGNMGFMVRNVYGNMGFPVRNVCGSITSQNYAVKSSQSHSRYQWPQASKPKGHAANLRFV